MSRPVSDVSLMPPDQRLIAQQLLIDELNERLTNAGINFQLEHKHMKLSDIAMDDLILNIALHDEVNRHALDYFNEIDNPNIFALQLACRYKWYDVVELLLKRGVPVDTLGGKGGDQPLIIATFYNFTSIAKLLIQEGADISKIALDGRTSLHFAAQHGNEEICQLLLSQPRYDGKNHNDEQDRTGKTPLHLAMLAGQRGKKVTPLLIIKGADLTFKDTEGGRCALSIAAGEGAADTIDMLLNSVPQKEKKNIQSVMDDALFIAVQVGSENAIETLISQGASVHAVMKGVLTPLHVAAINGRVNIVETLLSNGANKDALDHRHWNPFHRACLNGHLPIVKLDIWKKKKYITAVDNTGHTPIMLAILHGRNEVVDYLINMHNEFRVPLDMKDEEGQNILHKAVESKRPEMLKFILTKAESAKNLINERDGQSGTPLLHAAYCDNEKFIDLLVTSGAQITDADLKLQTPLHIASKFGYDNVVRSLMKADSGKIDTAALSQDDHGNTPLHNAADGGRLQTMGLILERCVDKGQVINAVNFKNDTPLHLACASNFKDGIKFLLRNGADVSIQNINEKTCLDEAAESENSSVCTQLITDKNTIDSLWKCKRICCIETLIKDHPSVVKEILDQCEKKTNEEESEFLFGALEYNEDRKNFFAPSVMQLYDQDELITHQVTKKLILHKWNKFGRWFHFIWFLINAVYTSFLTALVVTAKKQETDMVAAGNKTNTTCFVTQNPHFSAFPWVILAMIILYVVSQLVNIYHLKWRYLTPSNVCSLIVFIFTFIFIIPFIACHGDNIHYIMKGKEDLQWQFGALAILLSWINLLFHFKHLFYGIYVEMLVEVLKTWLKVIAVFCILIIGFALSFHCVLDRQASFRGPGIAIIKTIVWMIGEVDYDDMFIKTDLKYYSVSLFILIVFFIVMNITFINLLVGLAVGDIDAVQKKAFLILLKEKIRALEILYNSLPSCFRRLSYKTTHIDRKNHSIFSRILDGFGNVMMRKVEQDYYAEKRGESVALKKRKASWRRGAVVIKSQEQEP